MQRGYTIRRFWTMLAIGLFLIVAGFGVRIAEDNQVGYTHDSSMWVMVIGGLFVYYAGLVGFCLLRDKKKKQQQ